MPVVSSRELALATLTRLLEPLNDSAPPYLPLVDQVVFDVVPTLPLPEKSVTDAPAPSLNARARIKPVGTAFETVTVTGVEIVEFPPVSRTRAVRTWLPLETVVVFQLVENGPT